jgi:hypothetical protein
MFHLIIEDWGRIDLYSSSHDPCMELEHHIILYVLQVDLEVGTEAMKSNYDNS